MTPDHGARLRELGERHAERVTTLAGVRSVLLTGSAARGLPDRWSDVELMVFWDTPPDERIRRESAVAAGGQIVDFRGYDVENDEWSEDVVLDGTLIQVSHRVVASVDARIADVIDKADPDLTKQHLIALIRDGLVLHDTGVVDGWRASTDVYPDALAVEMVRAHLGFRSSRQRRKLLDRGDLLPLTEDRLYTARHVLLVLLGLNRVWFPHPGFKWMHHLAERLPLAPAGFPARLDALLTATPASAVPAADALIRETLILTATHLPQAGAETELAHLSRGHHSPG